MLPEELSFTRYLSAKKSVDDRALNLRVWNSLAHALPEVRPESPLQVLEVGAGIGTMVERMLDNRLLSYTHYTALDAEPENIAQARVRLPLWAQGKGFQVRATPGGMYLDRVGQSASVKLQSIDLFEFADRQIAPERTRQTWDLLCAHAFLDLVDIPRTLPLLFDMLPPEALFYFTLNFDGATILEPAIDPALDELIQSLYHRTMDERITAGKPSGDSQAGRHLFAHLKAAGARVLAVGSSDWLVYPGEDGYENDEAYFLHFIVQTISHALQNHPEIDPVRFVDWVMKRHAQIENGELVYIAHQLDYLGRPPARLDLP